MIDSPVVPADRPSIAVRGGSDAEENRLIEAHLADTASGDMVRFEPKDDDQMNEALSSGRHDRAVFANLDGLLEAIWSGHAKVDQWRRAGVRIEFASAPCSDPAVWQALVEQTCDSYERWCRRRRRRQVVTACILSALALAATAVLFLLIPPAR